jgi:SNF2 family DNA or RNA helicase
MASPPGLEQYIPTGSLIVKQAESGIPPDLWDIALFKKWRRVRGSSPSNGVSLAALPDEVQAMVMYPPALQPFRGLVEHRWVEFEMRVSSDDPALAIVRAYILPDDVARGFIDRSDPALRKVRNLLFRRLSFSPSMWNGQTAEHVTRRPNAHSPQAEQSMDQSNSNGTEDEVALLQQTFERFPGQSSIQSPPTDQSFASSDSNGDEVSLLQMFNSLPSPDPQFSSLDELAREVMSTILDSNVPGLETTLYPYQRRSAAVMYQREMQPGQVLDPRLIELPDQSGGRKWYYDHVNGVGLRHPRYYDGVRGGILAEQMGAGKTLICLALILATKDEPAAIPEIYHSASAPTRPKVGSLSDMAAAAINRGSIPWKLYFGAYERAGFDYQGCVDKIKANPAWYLIPSEPPRRLRRQAYIPLPPRKIFPSSCSLIIVPPNLVDQWKQEIAKHTTGLKVLTLIKKYTIPTVEELLKQDIILISSTRFERLLVEDGGTDTNSSYVLRSPLAAMHFKRCIVDEGHKLGNSRIGSKSNLLTVLDFLHFSARWIVTGTPSKGLYGVEDVTPIDSDDGGTPTSRTMLESTADEKTDLRKIGAIATLYLKARPWANTVNDGEDAPADWDVYVMLPRHTSRSSGRKDCLSNTLDSLIIRHRLSEITDLLPPVDEKIVLLDGSYQDKLALNLFSMMIVFNSVQSQRTDMDYFFHRRQRRALQELVSNLRQASFFGGAFFAPATILKSVETAEKFLEERKIDFSQEDETMLRDAVEFGRHVLANKLKEAAVSFHEVPLYVANFPGGSGKGEAWSLDHESSDPVCTDAPLIRSLQSYLRLFIADDESLKEIIEGGLMTSEGIRERSRFLREQLPLSQQRNGHGDSPVKARTTTLAGNTGLGEERNLSPSNSKKKRSSIDKSNTAASAITRDTAKLQFFHADDVETPPALANTQIISTASAKLSYLIDQIVLHQEDEQIIVFYEHDNVAYYLAGVLEILQIHFLIYARTLTPERRSQYVATFNHNPKFRVLLMDITQAAFGLDMRSASRIYFVSPVLNPQVEAQAVGRARRISQHRRVTVETLVLRGSLEEVIVSRKGALTMAEHQRIKSILDDGPMYEWIKNARVEKVAFLGKGQPLGADEGGNGKGKGLDVQPQADKWSHVPGVRETALLSQPVNVFGKGAGREAHPDEDLVMGDEHLDGMTVSGSSGASASDTSIVVRKRKVAFADFDTPDSSSRDGTPVQSASANGVATSVFGGGARPPRRVRFADDDDED